MFRQSWNFRNSVISTTSSLPEYLAVDPAGRSSIDDSRSVATLPRYSVIEPFSLDTESDDSPSSPTTPTTPTTLSEDRKRNTMTFSEGGDSQTQHVFRVEGDRKAKSWAVLRLYSRASSPSATPQILGGDDITGSVNLSLDSPQTINLVEIVLRGRIIKGNLEDETFTFLEHVVPVWSKASGLPNQSEGGSPSRPGSRLRGDHIWPFSFPFPTEIELSRGNDPKTPRYFVSPPQTFAERDAVVNVRYELTVRIHRGKLRSISRMRTPIVYVPKIIPGVPSPLRQQAYRDEGSLPGPKVDTVGWFSTPSVIVQGTLSKRHTEVKCTLSLANPLCYTRGTVIPCSLMLESSDSQLLEILAKPKRPDLRLIRRIKYYQEPGLVLTHSGKSQEPFLDLCRASTAVWWVPPKDGLHGQHERRLEGEMHLPSNLQPSTDFVLFSVEYTVVLYPFLSGDFIPTEHEPMLEQAVEIATFRCEGPEPRSFTQARPVRSTQVDDLAKYRQLDILTRTPEGSWFLPSPWG